MQAPREPASEQADNTGLKQEWKNNADGNMDHLTAEGTASSQGVLLGWQWPAPFCCLYNCPAGACH